MQIFMAAMKLFSKLTAWSQPDGHIDIIVHPRLIDYKYNHRHDIRWQLESFSILKRQFIIQPNRFGKVRQIIENDKFKRVLSLIENRNNYKQSKWYQQLLSQLNENKPINHKAFTVESTKQLNSLFDNYLIPLVDSISNGYQNELSVELGTAIINKDGMILKGPGATHRFYIAKILGIEEFPLRIKGIHKDWMVKNMQDSFDLSTLSKTIQLRCAGIQAKV